MPRDPRPFVTYPLNYTSHPRVEALSDPAFRVWHEMMDHSRVHGLDGAIPKASAEKRWRKRALAELVRGIDDRPLVILTDTDYLLRSYDEHQFTTADAEALSKKRAEAGSKGGKAKATAKQTASNGLASATARAWQNEAESESESEVDLDDVTNYPASSPEIHARATGLDVSESIQVRAKRIGIKNLIGLCSLLSDAAGERVTPHGAVILVPEILSRAKHIVRDVDAYVATVCRNTPDEVRRDYDLYDIGAVA